MLAGQVVAAGPAAAPDGNRNHLGSKPRVPRQVQMQEVQTFTGMIVKSGDKYVLQDEATGTTYDIDRRSS